MDDFQWLRPRCFCLIALTMRIEKDILFSVIGGAVVMCVTGRDYGAVGNGVCRMW